MKQTLKGRSEREANELNSRKLKGNRHGHFHLEVSKVHRNIKHTWIISLGPHYSLLLSLSCHWASFSFHCH